MITIKSTITINIQGNDLVLTREDAKELYNLLKRELGEPSASYPQPRPPIWSGDRMIGDSGVANF